MILLWALARPLPEKETIANLGRDEGYDVDEGLLPDDCDNVGKASRDDCLAPTISPHCNLLCHLRQGLHLFVLARLPCI